MPKVSERVIEIDVSPDRLTASVRLSDSAAGKALTAEQIVAEIEQQKIVIHEAGRQAIQAFSDALQGGQCPEPVVVARGRAAKDDEDGAVELLYKQAGTSQDGGAQAEGKSSEESESSEENYYDHSSIIVVEKDQKLVRVLPPVPGEEGCDVYGNVISKKPGREIKLTVGDNIQQAGDTFLAKCTGQLIYERDKIAVNSRLEIPGDVNFSVGSIDFPGDVDIKKNVLDLFHVVSASTITIQGIGEAATVVAAKNLEIRGGVAGKEKGVFTAGQDLSTKYITNAEIRAGHDITVQGEVINSTVVCGGSLAALSGPVVGGRCVVRGGGQFKVLGSDVGVKTIVEAGVDEDFRRYGIDVIAKIENKHLKLKKLKHQAQPLIENQKYLSGDQKKRLAELLQHVKRLLGESHQITEELRKRFEDSQQHCIGEITVSEKIYAGVILILGRYATVISSDLTGPVGIKLDTIDGIKTVIAVNSQTGTRTELPTHPNPDEMWDQLDRILAIRS